MAIKTRPTSKNETFNIRYRDRNIEHEKNPTLLGYTLDPCLTFKTFNSHAKTLVQRMRERIDMIRYLKGRNRSGGVKATTLITLYKLIVRSLCDYATPAIISMAKCHTDNIENLQSKALKMILNLPKRSSSDKIRNELGITTILERSLIIQDKHTAKLIRTSDTMRETTQAYLSLIHHSTNDKDYSTSILYKLSEHTTSQTNEVLKRM